MKHEKLEGRAKILRIFIDEGDYWEEDLLYDAILKKAHMLDLAGATVFKALKGYGGPTRYHHLNWQGTPTERPIMITIVDSEEKIVSALPVLDEMIGEGLIVLSDAEVIKYTRTDSP
ncbi:MAG: DUF190 domain-containing protein [Pyrinomonadaceae bacterium]